MKHPWLVRWNELATKHSVGILASSTINPPSIRLIGPDWLEQSNFPRFRLSNALSPSLSARLSPPYFLPPLSITIFRLEANLALISLPPLLFLPGEIFERINSSGKFSYGEIRFRTTGNVGTSQMHWKWFTRAMHHIKHRGIHFFLFFFPRWKLN